MESPIENKILEQHYDKYKVKFFNITLIYGSLILCLSFFESNLIFILHSITNYLFCGLSGLLISNLDEKHEKKNIVLMNLIFYSLNVLFNLYLSLTFSFFEIYNIVSMSMNIYFLINSYYLYQLFIDTILNDQKLTKKINNILENVSKFTPEQKKILRDKLFVQMKEILCLKKEIENKITHEKTD
jgi:hypothetical protein